MPHAKLTSCLEQARIIRWDERTLAHKSCELAFWVLNESYKKSTRAERQRLSLLQNIAQDPACYRFMHGLIYEVMNDPDLKRAAAHLEQLAQNNTTHKKLFSWGKQIGMSLFSRSPEDKLKTIKEWGTRLLADFVYDTQDPNHTQVLKQAKADKVELVFRTQSSPVIGQAAARAYKSKIEAYFKQEQAGAVQVELSKLCPQLNPYLPEAAQQTLTENLEPLLRLAQKSNGAHPIILDVGDSINQSLFVECIMRLLEKDEWKEATPKLMLAAYLHSSHEDIKKLVEWSAERIKNGIAPLQILLVKGNRLAQDLLNAQRVNREHALCASKAECEQNFRKLVALLMDSHSIEPSIGAHNPFDLAYCIYAWGRSRRKAHPSFTLLHSIAPHTARLLSQANCKVQVVLAHDESNDQPSRLADLQQIFDNAREKTSSFTIRPNLKVTEMEWTSRVQKFLSACSGKEIQAEAPPADFATWLTNTQDIKNSTALQNAIKEQALCAENKHYELVWEGKTQPDHITYRQRSLQDSSQITYSYTCLSFEVADKMVEAAYQSLSQGKKSQKQLNSSVLDLAKKLQKNRAELVAALMNECGHSLPDADYELGQAIAFCLQYSKGLDDLGLTDGNKKHSPKLSVALSSEHRPLADMVEALAAAWVSGSAIIIKPANSAMRLGFILADIIKQAGMSPPRVQIAAALNNQVTLQLLTHPKTDLAFLYTNEKELLGYDAQKGKLIKRSIQAAQGICSAIITADADWTRAIADCIRSFAIRSGQLSSCLHVLIVEKQLLAQEQFINTLQDAFTSIKVGFPQQDYAEFGPRVNSLTAQQVELIASVAKEARWLIEPKQVQEKSKLWSPGLSLGLSPNSAAIQQGSELPFLHIIEADDFYEALELQKLCSTGYRGALYTSNQESEKIWSEELPLSQAFINMPPLPCHPGIMPEGNMQNGQFLSGGSNFISALSSWSEEGIPQLGNKRSRATHYVWDMIEPKPKDKDRRRLLAAADSLSYWWEKEFGVRKVLRQSKVGYTELSYKPVPLCIRAEESMSNIELGILLIFALHAKSPLEISCEKEREWMRNSLPSQGITLIEETREQFEARFPELKEKGCRIRDIAATPSSKEAAAELELALLSQAILCNARLELLNLMREQTLTRCTCMQALTAAEAK